MLKIRYRKNLATSNPGLARRKDLALIKKLTSDAEGIKGPEDEVKVLVKELRKYAGTPRGTILRGEIVKAISAARKEVAVKVRGGLGRKWGRV